MSDTRDRIELTVVPRRRSKVKTRSLPTGVSRREYAEVVLRLATVELQAQRNRAEIELQTQRIVQLQDTVEALKLAASAALSGELAALPIQSTGTIESEPGLSW